MTPRRVTSLFESFNNAAEGVVHALRTQRNLWIHFTVAAAVLVAAIGFGVSKLELIVLLLAITFVLVAELVNTAIEAAVDVASTSFDPMAKLAKDIAAGAVLIASVNALVVGYLVFADRLTEPSGRLVESIREAPINLTLIALILIVLISFGRGALDLWMRPAYILFSLLFGAVDGLVLPRAHAWFR